MMRQSGAALLAVFGMCLTIAATAAPVPAPCNRACLSELAHSYVAALVELRVKIVIKSSGLKSR